MCCHPAAGDRVFRRGGVVVPYVLTALAVQLGHGSPWVLLRGVFKRRIKGHGRLCLGHVRATYVLSQADGPSNWIFSPNQRNLHPVFLNNRNRPLVRFPVTVIDVRRPHSLRDSCRSPTVFYAFSAKTEVAVTVGTRCPGRVWWHITGCVSRQRFIALV